MSIGLSFLGLKTVQPERSSLRFLRQERNMASAICNLNYGLDLMRNVPEISIRVDASVSDSGVGYTEELLGAEWQRKKRYVAGIDQDELLDPTLLADPDSLFYEFRGVQIHYKICHGEEHDLLSDNPTKKIGLPMILLHGFGASIFSWKHVMKPLAQIIGGKVIAFDRPAFGLTSRSNYIECPSSSEDDSPPLNPYSMMFSILTTLSLIGSVYAEKAILMGHSFGGLVAVNTYFECPERVAALILVAPAILAPFTSQKFLKGDQTEDDTQRTDTSNLNSQENLFIKVWKLFCMYIINIIQATMRMMKAIINMAKLFYAKVVSLILRSNFGVMMIRFVMDKFGVAMVRTAWYDSKVSDHVISGYTKPLKVRDWDKALLEFTIATLTDSKVQPFSLAKLSEISCPVLIITGDTDRIVPTWNSERLARVIPGCYIEVMKNCGHIPHEEKEEEFLSIVDKFLQRISRPLGEQILPALL